MLNTMPNSEDEQLTLHILDICDTLDITEFTIEPERDSG